MDGNFVIGLAQQVISLVVDITGPLLIVGLVVGLIISIFQATTQIQEQTLTFVPKIAAIIIVLLIAGPWMLELLQSFTAHILGNLSSYIS